MSSMMQRVAISVSIVLRIVIPSARSFLVIAGRLDCDRLRHNGDAIKQGKASKLALEVATITSPLQHLGQNEVANQ